LYRVILGEMREMHRHNSGVKEIIFHSSLCPMLDAQYPITNIFVKLTVNFLVVGVYNKDY
jgi:hypothetical protein